FVPMIDARRMEVYTAAYNFGLEELMKPQALILDEGSYADLKKTGSPILYFGSGAEKAQTVFANAPQAVYVPDVEAVAVDMIALAEMAYSRRQFIDTAYSTPLYIKDFQATTPKHKVL
ncbi:MAG: tRNA (adenosine(37)-N6)-threonylcarbamoyltransferase complex dimerization subunit type 1 TsaB, partial [Muribaculaceae bacterium]|nr:tRNA (adenosine(37)-N6)-threonylcarbamoyltransferase complex dimerization subunit type 1 TsaB [Muribaculaceae bacterium]